VKAKRICTIQYGVIFSIAIVVVSICSQIDLFLQVEYKVRSFKSETYNATINECSRTASVRTNTEYMIRTMFVVFLPCLILLIFTIMLIYKTKKIRRWRRLNTCKSGVRRSDLKNSMSYSLHILMSVCKPYIMYST
jgi:NADH:ubiquinone oxidoreductase subunit 3 (subunit A)